MCLMTRLSNRSHWQIIRLKLSGSSDRKSSNRRAVSACTCLKNMTQCVSLQLRKATCSTHKQAPAQLYGGAVHPQIDTRAQPRRPPAASAAVLSVRPVSAPPLGALPRSHPGPEASASSFTTPAPRNPLPPPGECTSAENMTGIAAASFFSNSCRFGGCGLQFESLAELIVHIEDNHIDTDPRVLEKQEQQQPTYLALSYINRFMTDAARREQETMKKKATPKLSLSITGGVSRNSTATPPRHTSGNLTPPVTPPITPSSSFRSSTPTGGSCSEQTSQHSANYIAAVTLCVRMGPLCTEKQMMCSFTAVLSQQCLHDMWAANAS
ncbi:juxtaposed with another zinc finger protein 1-like isoform X1, partial [Lates japonicus]